MRLLTLIRTVLLIAAFSTWGTADGQELVQQERWPDGTLRSSTYSDGDRTHRLTYYESGQVKEISSFRLGRPDGSWKHYSDSGALLTKAKFRNGERQGVWEVRDNMDVPLGRLTYSHGVLVHGEELNDRGQVVAHRKY